MPEKLHDEKKTVRTIAVTSGKSGVGKSSVVANLAAALGRIGKKVMILDAGLGQGKIDALLQVNPQFNILHVLSGEKSLQDIVTEDRHGILVLSAGPGAEKLGALDQWQRLKVLNAFDRYESNVDVLLIDTTAGISETVAFFCSAAQEIVTVTSPDPASIADACSLMKTLYVRYQEKDFRVLVNAARNAEDALEVFRRIVLGSEDQISIDYLGFLPFDECVPEAGRARQPFVDRYPDRPITRDILAIAKQCLKPADKVKGTLQFFIGNLLTASSDRYRYP